MTKNIVSTQYFTAYSISYEKANAKTRSKFTFFTEQLERFSRKVNEGGLGNCFIISTCNRTELYIYASNPEAIVTLFCETVGVSEKEFYTYAQAYTQIDALQHLFRVSAGLESQILGDFEIISQIKKWVKQCKKYGLSHFYIEKAINMALQISKEIKSKTSLSDGSASVAFSAVRFLMQSEQKIKKVLLIGTGKIGQNTCENLVKHLPNVSITAINRTTEKAEKLAEKYAIEFREFKDLSVEIQSADALIVSTNATQPIITTQHIPAPKDMIVIDLSIPNNVDTNVQENVSHILNVDDLSKIVDETLDARKSEIPKAEEIIESYIQEFKEWEDSRKFAPIIKDFKDNLDQITAFSTKLLQKKNVHINGTETILADKLSQKLTNRFAHYILENPEKATETASIINAIFSPDLDDDSTH